MRRNNKIRTIVISPSGSFYGSEQVLFNFLSNTTKSYKIYVPSNSIFYGKLQVLNKHKIVGFSTVCWLYLTLFWQFFSVPYKTLYINEGGHVKYAKLLAKLFKQIRIVVHIRILEDCNPSRLGQLPSNVLLIAISDYVSNQLNNYPHYKIYDPLDTVPLQQQKFNKDNSKFRIGIIGRVSESKGLKYYDAFFEYIISNPFKLPIEFKFFGDIMEHEERAITFYKQYQDTDLPILFKGFLNNQDELYAQLNMVLHLNPNEPLGRIGLESWARGIPFVCFNLGGTGEINQLLGMGEYSISMEECWKKSLKTSIEKIMNSTNINDLNAAQAGLTKFFAVSRYVSDLERLFNF